MIMTKEAAAPPKIMESAYGAKGRRRRAAEAPGIVSLEVKDLFPDIPREIYLQGDDLSAVRKAAEASLAGIDMGMIRPGDTINLLCSEHGFAILGGGPYLEMLKTTRDVVRERTGCRNIRLRVALGIGSREAGEIIRHFELDKHFRRPIGIGPFDRGVPIETEIGTLYGLAKAYDADWFIHAHYDDPREVYLHRFINRALKPFAMSYARLETRSVFHTSFGNRSANFVAKAIFESPFIQERYAFNCGLVTSPAGITGVDGDNDLHRFNRRLVVSALKSFGKLLRLFARIDECIVVLDGGRWPFYIHAGGLTSGNLLFPQSDSLDLDVASFREETGEIFNPAVKALIVNNAWMSGFRIMAAAIPTIAVGDGFFMPNAVIAESVDKALRFAGRIAETDKIIVFDGSYGGINLSPSLAEFLTKQAPDVSQNVDRELLPKWLRQRGIDPETARPYDKVNFA
jgi:hypothetical protein